MEVLDLQYMMLYSRLRIIEGEKVNRKDINTMRLLRRLTGYIC